MSSQEPGTPPPLEPQTQSPTPEPSAPDVPIGRAAAHAAPAPDASGPRSSPLGAIFTLIGALLVLAGLVTPWLSVTLQTEALQGLGASFEGVPASGGLAAHVESPFGQTAMIIGAALLICAIVGVAAPRTRRGIGILAVVLSIAVAGLAATSMLTAESRSRDSVGADFDAKVADIDVPEELQAAVDDVRAATLGSFDVAPGIGLWLAFGGAALGLVGGTMCIRSSKE